MKDQFSLFLPEYLLTRTVFYITLIWGLLTHFIDSISGFQGKYFERILIVFVMHILTFRAIQLTKFIFIDFVRGIWIPLALLIIVMFFTALRGIVLAYLYFWLEISAELSLFYRSTASLCNYSIAIFVATLTYGEIMRHKMISQRLIDNQANLKTINAQAESDLINLEAISLDKIQNQLRKLSKQIRSTHGTQLRYLLKESIEQVIKPLTNEIYQPKPAIDKLDLPLTEFKINWKRTLKNYANPRHLEYWGLVPTLAFMAAPVIGHAYGLKNGAFAILFFLIFVTGVIQLIGQTSVFLCEIFKNKFCRSIFYLSTFISAIVIYNFIALSSKILKSDFNPFWEVIVFSFMIHQINAFANEARIQANENTKILSDINDELRWKNSRLRMKQNSRTHEIADILHGQIQAKLVAAYLNLESENEKSEDVYIKKLADDLDSKIESLSFSNNQNLKIESVLEEISSMWSSNALVEVHSSDEVYSRINSDQPCLSTVSILLNELVFNSIKHGNSKQVDIYLALEKLKILNLKVCNNGDLLHNPNLKGTGSRLLDDVSISWSRYDVNEKLITEVRLPIT